MSSNIRRFVYNTLVDRANLCNLTREAQLLADALRCSDKIVIYGKRDSGKTSLVKSVVIPDWLRQTPAGMAIYIELYGVRSITDVAEKLTLYFNKAYQSTFTIKATLKSTAAMIKGLRPSFAVSPDGSIEASVTNNAAKSLPTVENFFANVKKLHENGVEVAIIIDEFQDIALATGCEELLREEMQKLPFEIPIIILGSKQHLLAKIFQRPRAPFFNWGKRLEIKPLPVEEYNDYIIERFEFHHLRADRSTLTSLQDKLLRNAEAINMFCSHIVNTLGDQSGRIIDVTIDDITTTLSSYIASLGGEFETYLDNYTRNEVRVLTLIAKQEILRNPMGKDNLSILKISASGLRKILEKLLDHADIYREKNGYVLSKPLLMHYLRDWRL